jgi:hypothetical protein
MQEVGGSIPPGSTSLRWLRQLRLGKPSRGEGCRVAARRAKTGLSRARSTCPIASTLLDEDASLMMYVYILESLDSEHFYVGITSDLRGRLAKHNAGEVRTPPSIGLGDSKPMLHSAMKPVQLPSRNI